MAQAANVDCLGFCAKFEKTANRTEQVDDLFGILSDAFRVCV